MSQPRLKVTAFEARTLSWWKSRRTQIDMEPPYQRRGRLWSEADKAYLIDSILNGFDVPKLYVADFTFGDSKLNKKRLPYAIIDGKQRLEAIFDFFDGKIVLNPDFKLLESPSVALGGLGYRDLAQNHAELAEQFDNYNLSVMSVITNSAELINELFVRLNRSKPLTGAEIRNAMSGPAPGVIRELAKADFFRTCVAFPVQRGQDLNAAAKILMFEFFGKPQGTKKTALDAFVKQAAKDRKTLELAGRRAYTTLADITSIFLPRDKLLASAGILPVYYWFIRSLKAEEYPGVRDFLVHFEDERRDNRAAADDGRDPKKLDRELHTYDQYNRSTNDPQSHTERLRILQERFSRYQKQQG